MEQSDPREDELLSYLRQQLPDLAEALDLESAIESRSRRESQIEGPESAELEGRDSIPLQQGKPIVPDFELLRELGKGGFGVVWLARNIHDHHLYAVKILRAKESVELAGVREFKRRAISNPFLVSISHVGKTGDHFYYVMRLADNAYESNVVEVGGYEPMTLQLHVLRTGGLDTEEVISVANRLLLGLEHLHDAGVSHNDVKPANILRIDGTWQLGDPGLMTELARGGAGRGTRDYTLNEPGVNGKIGDLYGLAMTMRFMLSASLSKPLDTAGNAEYRTITTCIDRACSVTPTARFASAREMRQVLTANSIVAGKRSKRNAWAWVAMPLIALTVAACAFVAFNIGRTRKQDALVVFDTSRVKKRTTKQLAGQVKSDQLSVSAVKIGPGLGPTNSWFDGRFAPVGVDSETIEESIRSDDYLSFKVTIKDGSSLDITGISACLFSQNHWPRGFILMSSATGFEPSAVLTDFGGPVTANKSNGHEIRTIDLSDQKALRDLTDTVELRIYVFGPNHGKHAPFEAVGFGDSPGDELTLYGTVSKEATKTKF